MTLANAATSDTIAFHLHKAKAQVAHKRFNNKALGRLRHLNLPIQQTCQWKKKKKTVLNVQRTPKAIDTAAT